MLIFSILFIIFPDMIIFIYSFVKNQRNRYIKKYRYLVIISGITLFIFTIMFLFITGTMRLNDKIFL